MTEYADRNPMELGETYVKHVGAMTAEGLHAKSDIAAELAWRDIQIERLREVVQDLLIWRSQPEVKASEQLAWVHGHRIARHRISDLHGPWERAETMMSEKRDSDADV